MKKLFFTMFALLVGFASNAFAITAADIDTTTALADLAVALIAVLGVAVTIFGYKKLLGLFGR